MDLHPKSRGGAGYLYRNSAYPRVNYFHPLGKKTLIYSAGTPRGDPLTHRGRRIERKVPARQKPDDKDLVEGEH
jgi:hypothetical protein